MMLIKSFFTQCIPLLWHLYLKLIAFFLTGNFLEPCKKVKPAFSPTGLMVITGKGEQKNRGRVLKTVNQNTFI